MTRFIKLPVLLIFIISALSSAATEIIINGSGYSEPLGNHPQTTVEVFDKSDMTLLGSATTDENGDYIVSLVFASIGNVPDKVNEGARLIQNPSGTDVNVELSSKTNQNWQVMVYDDAGRLLCAQTFNLASGTSGINISGLGVAGMKTIVLKGISKQYALKAILSQSVPLSPRVEVSAASRILKSAIVGDSLLVVFTPPSQYFGMDTTVVMQSQMVNYVLQQIPYDYNYMVYAYDITDGSPVIDNTALKFNWADGTSSTFYSDDGIISIYHSTFDTATSVYIENGDTSFYQEWIFGVKRENLITTKELNLFQNEKEQSPAPPPNGTGEYYYPTPAPANLSMLPDTFEIYFVPVIVYDSEDQPYSTRDIVFRTTVATQGNPYFTKKWEIGQWDTTYLYEMQMWYYYGWQLTPEESLAQEVALDSATSQVFNLRANGRSLFPPYKRVKIYDYTEPEYLEGEARGWDQVHITQYIGNENACAFTLDSTFSGYWRFKNGIAHHDGNMTYKMAEICQSFTQTNDPPNGNMGPKIVYGSGHMTTFGLVQCHLILLADPATIFW
jgi:hypothetical protein